MDLNSATSTSKTVLQSFAYLQLCWQYGTTVLFEEQLQRYKTCVSAEHVTRFCLTSRTNLYQQFLTGPKHVLNLITLQRMFRLYVVRVHIFHLYLKRSTFGTAAPCPTSSIDDLPTANTIYGDWPLGYNQTRATFSDALTRQNLFCSTMLTFTNLGRTCSLPA